MKKHFVALCAAAAMCVSTGVVAFAEEVSIPTVAITTADLVPVVTSITETIGVALPIGLALFGTMFSVKFIPKIFKMFAK